jgi:hypothetical protein
VLVTLLSVLLALRAWTRKVRSLTRYLLCRIQARAGEERYRSGYPL